MPAARSCFLLGDVGGTTARFARYEGGKVGPVARLAVAEYPAMVDALRAFLGRARGGPLPLGAAIAAAGPVEGGRVRLTNSPWCVAEDEIRSALGLEWVTVVNDYVALAWALARLGRGDLVPIGGGGAVPAAPAAVIGPGTGLGVGVYVPRPGGGTAIASEGGHVTLPAADAREAAVIEVLRQRVGHVSAERALSGEGLVKLYRALAAADGLRVPKRTAAEVTEQALSGGCAVSRAALEMFSALLGTVSGDLALTLGARGGVFVGGGIVPRFVDFFARSRFRERFEAKGRFRPYLERIPTAVIVHPDPTLVGLGALVDQETRGEGAR